MKQKPKRSIQCPELTALIRARLLEADLPEVSAMRHWTSQELADFDAIQEVVMCAVYDFAIRETGK